MAQKKSNKSLMQRFSEMSVKAKIIAIAIIYFLIIIFWFMMISGHHSGKFQKLTNKQRLLQQTYNSKMKFLKQLKDTAKSTLALQKEIKEIMQQLANKSAAGSIFDQINQAGFDQRLRFIYFRPQQREIKEYYVILPIKISVIGEFHDIATFISKITNLDVLIVPRNFILMRRVPNSDTLSMNLEIEVYFAKSEESTNDT